jgi:hypothetical protein
VRPNYRGIAQTFARGAHTNDPEDPQYPRHWDTVPGSLRLEPSVTLIGSHQPDDGSAEVVQQCILRFCGGTVYLDTAVLPEAPLSVGKIPRELALDRAIEPAAIPASMLYVVGAPGRRAISIPPEFGGGRFVERRNAIAGRANDASAWQQVEALLGFISNPRLRRNEIPSEPADGLIDAVRPSRSALDALLGRDQPERSYGLIDDVAPSRSTLDALLGRDRPERSDGPIDDVAQSRSTLDALLGRDQPGQSEIDAVRPSRSTLDALLGRDQPGQSDEFFDDDQDGRLGG